VERWARSPVPSPPLLRRDGDGLGLQLLDMVRIGVLYGLLLDGFKLL